MMETANPRPRLRKPEEICQYSIHWDRMASPDEMARFIESGKKEIERRLSLIGLHLRRARLNDMKGIQDLHRRCFPPQTETLEDPYVLYRILSFGYAPIIEGPGGRILGCNICEGHDDPDRTAYGVRITVDPSVSGDNLGAELVLYSCLMGMERGSKTRRGLLSPKNYGSASNFLNYVGYVGEWFNPDLPGFGPRFSVALPLTPGGIMNNRIDYDKLKTFMDNREKGRDYVVVDCEDLEGIQHMYQSTPFRVAAFLRQGLISEKNQFVALPKDRLGLP